MYCVVECDKADLMHCVVVCDNGDLLCIVWWCVIMLTYCIV